MSFDPKLLQLYAVTDRQWTGRQTLIQQLEAALQGGVTLVQLREKDLDDAAFLAEAREVVALCHRYGVPCLINDNLPVALAAGADGVHVGQEDQPVAAIRRQAGPDFLIGATAKTLDQALAAQVMALCQKAGVPCILHTFVGAARALGARAIHLPLPVLRTLSAGERAAFPALGASCH